MTWFSVNYGPKICQTFISTSFPYMTLNTGGHTPNKAKKHKTDADVVLDLFGDSMVQSDIKCSKQNIDLCLVYFLLSKYKILPVPVKIISLYINSKHTIIIALLIIVLIIVCIFRFIKFVQVD